MNSFRKRRRGAALVEFAFVGILFIAILLGMIQFGIYLSATNTLWNLSREGARFAAVQIADPNNSPANNAAIVKHVQDVAEKTGIINPKNMSVTITPPLSSARTQGTAVSVRITYDMTDKILFRTSSNKPTFIAPGEKAGQIAQSGVRTNYTTETTMMVER